MRFFLRCELPAPGYHDPNPRPRQLNQKEEQGLGMRLRALPTATRSHSALRPGIGAV